MTEYGGPGWYIIANDDLSDSPLYLEQIESEEEAPDESLDQNPIVDGPFKSPNDAEEAMFMRFIRWCTPEQGWCYKHVDDPRRVTI